MGRPLGFQDCLREEGLWWLPNAADRRVAGTLTYDPAKGAELSLLGMLGEIEDTFGTAGEEAETIHGVTKSGRPVTLLRSIARSRQLNFPGIPNVTYVPSFVAIGLHFADDVEPIFEKSYVRFKDVESWLDEQPFERDFTDHPRTIRINVSKSPVSEFARFDDHIIGTATDLYSTMPENTEVRAEVYSYLTVESEEPRSLEWHFMAASRLQELASLCSGHYLPLISFRLKGGSEVAGGKLGPKTIDCYTHIQQPVATGKSKYRSPFILAKELISNDSAAVERWFQQYDTNEPAINLFFAVTSDFTLYTNVRFLLAVQALESFHRRTTEMSVINSSDYAELKDHMVASIPDNADSRIREKLMSLFQFANEPSLNQRLRSIFEILAGSFGTLPAGFTKKFIRSVVDTRNYFTHFSPELEAKSLNSLGMYWETQRIILLLTSLFLIKIGVKGEQIEAAMTRHSEFERLWSSPDYPF